MKKPLNRFMVIAAIGTSLWMAGCADEDAKPSAPQVISESTVSIAQGEAKSFNITISAAGKIKTIEAVLQDANFGSLEIAGKAGIGEATGSATINYTAPYVLGKTKIMITVTDNEEQQVTTEVEVNVTEHPPIEVTGTLADGAVWGPNLTYVVKSNVTIPAGKKLLVKEGTTVIVDGAYAININGNFYSYGTAESPILFTVPESKRTKENIFAGLWGGILAPNNTTTEMAVIYTRIEYTGMPGVAGTDIVDSEEVAEGDPTYALYFNNPNGKVVVLNSTFAYTVDVAVQINKGALLVANNTFILNGKSGGESVNMKPGAIGDVAFNVFYSAATNGVKSNNSKPGTLAQNNVNIYNNTAVNCGWRQTKAGRGGSYDLEKGGRGQVYNNMAVNSRYGVKFPQAGDAPDVANTKTGYNLYYGNNDESVAGFYPTEGIIVKSDANPQIGFETSHDVSGAKGEYDPKFVNLNVTTFDATAAKNSANVDFPAAFNLKLQAGSPALEKGKTGFSTNFTTHSIDGKTYTVPAPASYIGAFGVN